MGLLQTFADALKFVVRNSWCPRAPTGRCSSWRRLLSFVLAVLAWAVIPFNENWVLADINVAILFVFAVSSLEVYGVIMGGWASNSKYPFLGSLRSAAQMISYEVSLGLIIIGIIISDRSMNLSTIVAAQDGDWGLFNWYWLPHLPMVFCSSSARWPKPTARLRPARARIGTGRRVHVEYSSTRTFCSWRANTSPSS